MNIKLIAALAASISLSACSTIANGKNQAVQFTTGDVEGADCVVSGGRDGAVNLKFSTPAEVQVRRAKAAIDVECSKAGYETASRTVESKMEGSTGGNVVAGGFVGLGVDAMTGAMFKYPDTIIVKMKPVGVTTPTVTGEPIS
ncbi:hypothetical protein GCM10011309_26880 [Litorimonas cladophorae]|uniref:Lipoprotein n=1 Tax=Litorimonas cladophorae TaxID=1220491 RepID=A0A918KSE6_9PROT|nr:hypothetical protein [Litorimonas cladophorae]GGX75284.1 hypothetical protein GCM10011309_26880 [Litorimonas cladophorae]